MLTIRKPEWPCSNAFCVKLNIANTLFKYLTADFEQKIFSLYTTNYLPALASKALPKGTSTGDKEQGAILNAFQLLMPQAEDTLNSFFRLLLMYNIFISIIYQYH